MSYLFLGWRRSRSPVKKGVNEQDLHLFLPRNLLQLQPRVTQGTSSYFPPPFTGFGFDGTPFFGISTPEVHAIALRMSVRQS